MELLMCSKKDNRQYLNFVKTLYSKYPNFKDYSSPLLKQFLYKKGSFCSSIDSYPAIIKKDNKVVAACIYIYSPNYKETLQISFFESLEGEEEAVDLIINKGKEICKLKKLKKIVLGLNGHVNYGLGFLMDNFNKEISFGSSFNPPYYIDYFKKYNPICTKLLSYSGLIEKLNFSKEDKIIKRVYSRYTFRNISFKKFREEMKTYTDLNNICFKDHPFYFKRSYGEDYELFKELKLFIKEENIIFVEKEGVPIGYMLWYPDFNELIPYGKTIGIGTFIKNKIFGSKIKKMKIVEIAILPEYKNSGAIFGLFNECYKRCLNRYKYYESSWILEGNFKSKGFGLRWADNEYKHYIAYEIPIQEDK